MSCYICYAFYHKIGKEGFDLNNKLVSIIIPVYNTQLYLNECLTSIMRQSYENIEVLIIDDGSTDNSEMEYLKFKYDKRFTFYKTENKGLSHARQFGLKLAKGEFIITIDSDDYVSNDFVEQLYRKINDDEADICVCAKNFVIDNSVIIETLNVNDSVLHITPEILAKSFCQLAEDYHMSDSWNKIYRKSFIDKTRVNYHLDKKYNGTDLLFNHTLLLHCPIITSIPKQLYNYRIRLNSQVRRKKKQMLEGFRAIIKDLLTESTVLNYTLNIKYQISELFIILIRTGLLDLLNESTKFHLFKSELIKSYEFDSTYSFDLTKINTRTTSLYIFKTLYRKRLTRLIWFYMRIYSYFNKLKVKMKQKRKVQSSIT